MGLFGKKQPDRDEIIKQGLADAEAAAASAGQSSEKEVKTGNDKVDIELTKIQAQLEGLSEFRKANSERFTRVSEQLGELRGMIVDTNKAISKIEVAATKAVDLVESVHPEKLMVEVRKQDGKIEALRANIEGNESVMKDIMSEMKKMREQISFYKGVEQVAKMNDEVKQELANVKKMEAVIERHADKVETIFVEVQRKFSEFDKFDSLLKDLESETKKMGSEMDKMRVKLDTKEEKKEFVTLVDKFNNFETHTTNLLKLLDERSKTLKEGLESDFAKLKRKLERKLKTGEIDMDAPDESGKPKPRPRGAVGAALTGSGAHDDDSGADVVGGDVRKPNGFLSRLKGFGKKVVDQSLEGGSSTPVLETSADQSRAESPSPANVDAQEKDD